ncbi:hypothetical protein EIN_418620 [Entamoeba invadens IP1]|uniref:Uncharacterized protein n=1 Tax=Entamoeba invadens IP1 TaxID=370355 RepID=A0A0A1U1R7_ENTIV|nr:hypothetical protein EIN_418620 [Entamoeba invadens IP1]ELP87983.1 hypothetical protein EIN_418620 [Entamoeba invadens IP1]|eukprot:XP_004254754.1 hypothetical protein EIN_418620 [Entamoeba invadens IP1]
MSINRALSKKHCHEEDKENPYSFFQVRNYQAQQEAVFLTILNQEYDVVLEVPQKKSVIALSYFRVIRLKSPERNIEFGSELNSLLEKMYFNDMTLGVTEGTASRRLEINRISESIHKLIELIEPITLLKKCFMGKRNSRASVVELSFDGINMKKDDIEKKGERINKAITLRMKGLQRKDVITLPKQDLELMSLFFV